MSPTGVTLHQPAASACCTGGCHLGALAWDSFQVPESLSVPWCAATKREDYTE
jgi:hypothetical protein